MSETICTHCNGTGIEPHGQFVVEDGRKYALDPDKRCPRCDAPLMFGDPGHGVWHCSAIGKKDPDWMGHFAASRLVETRYLPDELLQGQAR